MIRHILFSSFISAGTGSIAFILACLPFYGVASLGFGLFSFPAALGWCLLCAYPMLSLKKRLSATNYFLTYLGAGVVLGIITPSIIVGDASMLASTEVIFVYGSLGLVTAMSGWFYAYRYVRL